MNIWDSLEKELRVYSPRLFVKRDEPMSGHTSFRVGGPAAMMIFPQDSWEASMVIQVLSGRGIRPFFMGNGSNLLVSDTGYDGVILKTLDNDDETDFGEYSIPENVITAGSGILMSRLAHYAALDCNGLAGLEFATGIPGTLGGAVVMNAGAYGGEMSQIVRTVTYLNEEGKEATISGGECKFSYRHSIFTDHPEWLILYAQLELPCGDPAAIRAKMSDLAVQRKAKQPLEYPSAGSTFKRPAPLPDGTPVYAAALIDQCGCKGLAIGGAQVSEKHAGFIINKGGATCADILALIREVQKRVLDQTGVSLEMEVKTLGI